MKKLGIIGGAGPMASALFYQTIIQESNKQEKSMIELILGNYVFQRGLTVQEGNRNDATIRKKLQEATQELISTPVDHMVIVCNTLHQYTEQLPYYKSFFSLTNIVLKHTQAENKKKILVLGTERTVEAKLYERSFLEIVYPDKKDQIGVNYIIDHILKGILLEKDTYFIEQLIYKIVQTQKIDGAILGCTELPVLHDRHPIMSNLPIYDSVKLPARYIYPQLSK